MSRIFLSHSSSDESEAIALKQWLTEQGWDDVFLDVDPERGLIAGERWQDALKRAADRCEAVLFLVSPAWASSKWCLAEFLLAKSLNKRIFGAITKPVEINQLPVEMTSEWQLCQLIGEGAKTNVHAPKAERNIDVAFLSEGLARLGRGLKAAGLTADYYGWPPVNEPDRIPYRGLRSLDIADAAVFFGRDPQIIRSLDALRGMRANQTEQVFVILGGSGSGKSSFMRAGLWPRLARDDRHFFPLPIVRPETRVLTGENGLATALLGARRSLGLTAVNQVELENGLLEDSPEKTKAMLAELRAAASKRLLDSSEDALPPTLVLSIDQAEELFIPGGAEEAGRFFKLMGSLLSGEREISDTKAADLIVMLTIRSDRYAQWQTIPELTGVRSRLFDDLKPLPGSVYKEIIEGPARVSSGAGQPLKIEAQLTERLIAESSGADALPMLAFTLERLYRKSAADGDLRLEEYEAMGGIARSMEEAIERVLTETGGNRDEQLKCLRQLFIPWLARIDEQDGMPLRQVCEVEMLPAPSVPLMDRLTKAGLLLCDHRNGKTVVEIAHESLLRQWAALSNWLKEESGNLKIAQGVKRAAQAWVAEGKKLDYLAHRGSRLAEAEALLQRPDYARSLREVAANYVHACRGKENDDHGAEIKRLEQEKALAEQLQQEAQARQNESEQRRQEAETATQRQRRLKKRAWLVAAFAVFATLLAGLFGLQAQQERAKAINEKIAAISSKLSGEAERVADGRKLGTTEQAYLLALTSWRLHDSDVSLSALHAGLAASPHTYKIQHLEFEPTPALAYSPTGDLIALGGKDGLVRIQNALTGSIVGKPMAGHRASVWALAFSGDGRKLVTSAAVDIDYQSPKPNPTEIGELILWEVGSQRLMHKFMGHIGDVYGVAYGKRGDVEIIASAGADGTVRLWNAANGAELWQKHLIGQVVSVAISPDGKTLASAGEDKNITLWDTANGKMVSELKGHRDLIEFVQFSPDGRLLASASDDGSVRIWDIATKVDKQIDGHKGRVYGLSFNPDEASRMLATAGDDGVVHLWDIDTAKTLPNGELRGLDQLVYAVAFSPDGSKLASTSLDGKLVLWGAKTPGFSLVEYRGHNSKVTAIAVSSDSKYTASGDQAGHIHIWKVSNPNVPFVDNSIADWSDSSGGISSLSYCPDGSSLISAGEDGTLRIWQSNTGKLSGPTLRGHGKAVRSVVCGQNNLAVSGGDDGTIRVWDLKLRTNVRVIPMPSDLPPDFDNRILSLSLSPDGKVVASGANDQRLRLWDVASGKPLHRALLGHSATITSVAFSPDGKNIVTGDADGLVMVWDTTKPRSKAWDMKVSDYEMRLRASNAGEIGSVAYSQDGRFLLAAGGVENSMQLWDARNGSQIGLGIKAHASTVRQAKFTPDGQFFISAGDDKNPLLWPGPAIWAEQICKKLTRNMNCQEWNKAVSSDILYRRQCPELPGPPDQSTCSAFEQ
jgi:WD40 repeat protein